MNSGGPVGFDLDLTLIDSRAAIMAAWSAVAADTGTRIDLSDVDRRMGDKLEDRAGLTSRVSRLVRLLPGRG